MYHTPSERLGLALYTAVSDMSDWLFQRWLNVWIWDEDFEVTAVHTLLSEGIGERFVDEFEDPRLTLDSRIAIQGLLQEIQKEIIDGGFEYHNEGADYRAYIAALLFKYPATLVFSIPQGKLHSAFRLVMKSPALSWETLCAVIDEDVDDGLLHALMEGAV
jgi:hypothetical protein